MAATLAERLARRLFPDDYHDGYDCRMEVGNEGNPCRACAEQAANWTAAVAKVDAALKAEDSANAR